MSIIGNDAVDRGAASSADQLRSTVPVAALAMPPPA
jgi:hypothetical protein